MSRTKDETEQKEATVTLTLSLEDAATVAAACMASKKILLKRDFNVGDTYGALMDAARTYKALATAQLEVRRQLRQYGVENIRHIDGTWDR